MRKYIMIGLVALASGYATTTLAASGNILGSGNIGSGALGTDNAATAFVFGGNPKLLKSGGGLGQLLAEAFDLADVGFSLASDGVTLLGPDGLPFNGTHNGKTYVKGKAQ